MRRWVRGEVREGGTGLLDRIGAWHRLLDTTEEAGTCWASRSTLGLVGSSVRKGESYGDEGMEGRQG